MADLTPEHTSRRMDGDLHPEVRAAYRYVESVVSTADAQSPVGGYAWHGWSLREAFLAGCTHARTQLAQPEPKKSKPVVDYSRVPEIATEAQIRSAAQHLVKKRNCDGDLIPAIKYAIARWGNPTPQPPAEGEVAELVEGLGLIAEEYACDGCPNSADHFTRAAELLQRQHPRPVPVAIPGEEYHEDMGPVTWWRLPVEEPPWVGTPNDSDWPGYHTHFTPAPPTPCNAHALPLPTNEEFTS